VKVFITGVAGFIGGSVAVTLIKAGHEVSGLVRSEARARDMKSPAWCAVKREREILSRSGLGRSSVTWLTLRCWSKRHKASMR
jgi:nucleoside-diphosphate-sugar epimerase